MDWQTTRVWVYFEAYSVEKYFILRFLFLEVLRVFGQKQENILVKKDFYKNLIFLETTID